VKAIYVQELANMKTLEVKGNDKEIRGRTAPEPSVSNASICRGLDLRRKKGLLH
jgi:hypothetical protein